MKKEHQELLNKVEEVDLYFKENFDPVNNESLLGTGNPEKEKQYKELRNSLYQLAQKAGTFKSKEEIEIRNRAMVQLQLMSLTEDVKRTALPIEVPEDGAERKAFDEKRKEHDAAVLKLSIAVSGMEKGEEHISQKADLDMITWVRTQDLESLQKTLDNKTVSKVLSVGPESSFYNFKKTHFGKGTMSSFLTLIPNGDGSYALDAKKTAEKALNNMLKDKSMKAMISAFTKAESYWATSAMSPSQEIENRLRMVNTYSKQLKLLNDLICLADHSKPEVLEGINNVLGKKGIREMLKDYRTFYDKDNKLTEFIADDMNDMEREFRKNYDTVKNQIEPTLTKSAQLQEFQDYLFQNSDYGTAFTAESKGIIGSTRPFIENFVSLPEKDQLKTLYVLENNLQGKKGKITDEMLEKYKPDVKKAIANMSKPKWKFWTRLNYTYIDFNKLKSCQDKALNDRTEVTREATKADKALKRATKMSKVKLIASKVTHNLKKTKVATAALTVLGFASAIKKTVDTKDLTNASQKADIILDQTAKAAGDVKMQAVMGIVTKSGNIPMLMKASGYLGIAQSSIEAVKSVKNIAVHATRSKKAFELTGIINDIRKDKSLSDSQKATLDKLETNAKILQIINKDKVKYNTAGLVKSAANLASSSLIASGVGAVLMAPAAIVSIGSKVVQGKIAANDTKSVVDAHLYKDEAQKAEKIKEARATMEARYLRMPEKVRNKYKKDVTKLAKDDSKVAAKLRDEATRKSGDINVKAFRNKIVHNIGEDIAELLMKSTENRQPDQKMTELDKKLLDLANKFVEAAGGKKVDLDEIEKKLDGTVKNKQEQIKQVAAQKITVDLAL